MAFKPSIGCFIFILHNQSNALNELLNFKVQADSHTQGLIFDIISCPKQGNSCVLYNTVDACCCI